jgi:hypothetical protein
MKAKRKKEKPAEKPTVRVKITTFEHPDCTRIEIVLTGDEESRSMTKAAVLIKLGELDGG